ncbi:MAG: GIY-YIG nuclease family protein [Methylococcales bacterium]|nr:GIY-YIG nuclease family protein [Methylococcales bacterium]
MKPWFVYIVRCRDNSLYTGIALDVQQRIEKHNSGDGAKYTRSRRPVKLVRKEKYATESQARKREAEIKGLTRIEKENLF